jgi:hypothetical protein
MARYDFRVRLIPGMFATVAVGAAFGAGTSLINNVPAMLGEVGRAHSDDSAATWIAIFLSLILDSGWAWAALGFVLGWLTGTPTRLVIAAVAGATGLLMATASYYVTDLLFGIDADLPTVGYWVIRAFVFGPPLGVSGALARSPGPVGFLAGLTVPVGAAMNTLLFPPGSGVPGESSATAYAELSVWTAAAVGAVAVTLRFVRTQRRLSAVTSGNHASEVVADARAGRNGQ